MKHQMNHPPVVELENKAGCRYMLVSVVSKRARQIQDIDKNTPQKPVAIAVNELDRGELNITYPSEYYQTSEK